MGLRNTRPRRPQTNGKAERFIKTLQTEWAYLQPYTTNQERLDALPDFLQCYNYAAAYRHRQQASGLSPVNNSHENHS